MPNSREIRNRIKSVNNTGKITKTMGMVAAAKSAKAMNTIKASRPYSEKMREVLGNVLTGEAVHPLIAAKAEANRRALVVVTANRGLCGGYNTNVVKLALKELADDQDVFMIGKKGANTFRYLGKETRELISDIPDIPDFTSGQELIEKLMSGFVEGKYSEVRVVYMRFYSAGVQKPEVETLLPMTFEKGDDPSGSAMDPIFEPDRDALLQELIPKVVRLNYYRILLEAATSEHLARQMAMNSASDNAGEMVKSLTLQYNRARQAQITTEISEIVGGAEALN